MPNRIRGINEQARHHSLTDQSEWIPTTATVVSCKFQFAGSNTLLLGFQTGKKFRIAFDYVAHGQTYSDELQSAVAIPQGEQFPIRYNPLQPRQNDRSGQSIGTGRTPLIAFGTAGSIVLSLIWLTVLRGCN